MTERLPAVIEDRAPAVPQHDPDAYLSPDAVEDVGAGIPHATSAAYEGDFRRFAAWCAGVGRRPMPAVPETVTEYVSYLTRTPRPRTGRPYGPASIERAIASLRTAHKAAGFIAPETKGARKVLSGYQARLSTTKDPAATARKASPAVPAVLRATVATLDRTTLTGKRDAALLLLGSACAARASELVPLDIDASITRHPEGRGITVLVYRKKRKRWQKVAVPYGQHSETCPVRAVDDLVAAMADEGRTTGPLFVRIDQWGYLAPPMVRHGKPIGDPSGRMTTESASDIVERTITASKIPGRWKSHSLRHGFVNGARANGADIVTIGRHGDWDDGSRALLGYIKEDDGWTDRNPLLGIGL